MLPHDDSSSPKHIPADPLFGSQWHLLNVGQAIMGLPQDADAYKNDINVVSVWPDYTGQGVVVGVIDDGVQAIHPDLAPNLLTDKFYDLNANTPGNPDGSHGTASIGLILEAQNGLGGVGVAYGSKGIGYRQRPPSDVEGYKADVKRLLDDKVDVSSNSWGIVDKIVQPFSDQELQPDIIEAQQELAHSGRNGLGTVTLFAGGNDREYKNSTLFDPYNNSPYVINVAAANADGTVTTYSTQGPNVLVAAPGSGGNSGSKNPSQVPSIVTTDLLGTAGDNKRVDGDYTNVLETFFDEEGNYDETTSSSPFNGTSAATPIAAGVVALMLEANPLLGYREVQEILAYSARTPDAVATWKTNGATDWNGGGHRFNDDLGFGLIDARAAVRMAESWWPGRGKPGKADVATAEFTGADGIEIEAGGTATVTASFVEPLRVQHVTVSLSMKLENDAPLNDVTVTLIGPNGRVVTPLVDPDAYNPDLPLPNVLTYDFSSVQNWGERADAGEWKLEISNGNADADLGLSASISVIGDLDTEFKKLVYTDDYASLGSQDDSRRIIAGETNLPYMLNAAAVTSNTYVDLDGRVAVIAGVTTRIADGVTLKMVDLGDGDDVVNGDASDTSITTGRGDDNAFGGAGNDVLTGGDGDDRLSGDDGQDMVSGEGGDDVLSGGAGNDALFGGSGNDLLLGQGDDDRADGGDGRDIVNGGDGNDTLFGSAGDDIVLGTDGNDFLGTGYGNDFGSGGFGNDEVHGEVGDDLLFGDDGNDGVYGGDGNDLVYGGTGNDYMTGDAGRDALFGESGNDMMFGGAADDYLSGGAGDDRLEGGTGNDLLFGNAGNDMLAGGEGADVFAFGSGDGVDEIFDFSAAEDVLAFNNSEIHSYEDFQRLSFQAGADVMVGYNNGFDLLVLQNTQLASLSAANLTFA